MFAIRSKRKEVIQSVRKCIYTPRSYCVSNFYVNTRNISTTSHKNVWRPSFSYDNKRTFCAQVLIQEQLSPRVQKLNELFLQVGAPTLDASIDCAQLENTLLKMVDGVNDSFMKDFIHQIVSTGDYDKTGTINKEEFFQWFEPISDENLNLQELLKYWSTNSEFKNSKVIFSSVWNALVAEFSEEKLIFPAEILCLGGAPGSGKGTNTPFILRERDIEARPIVMSSLLQSPAMQKIKASGGLVSDNEVLKLLLSELLLPKYRRGAVVDGFPRTAIQVDFLRLLRDQMIQLQLKYSNTPLSNSFSRPAFRIIVLYVNEAESVRRQLARGKIAMEHNEQVRLSGHGELWELRETDISPAAARKRYKVFSEEALDALQSLKKEFPYHVIDASGTIEQVEKEIMKELAYQSSMELSADTYEAIKDIPTSKSIITNARQRLVQRLDQYQAKETKTFHEIIAVIKRVFVPVLRRHALSGAARVIIPPDDPAHKLLHSSPNSIGMIIDILADRDFSVYAVEEKEYGSMFDVRFQTRTFLHKDEDSA